MAYKIRIFELAAKGLFPDDQPAVEWRRLANEREAEANDHPARKKLCRLEADEFNHLADLKESMDTLRARGF